jgi:hypothetical protein
VLSREQLQGILLAASRPELTIYRNEKKNLGYEVRARVFFRADSEGFLRYIETALMDENIPSQFRLSESKVRPKPVLWVSGITNLNHLARIVPDYPDAKCQWDYFKLALDVIYEGEHNTQVGLDKLLKLKGLL